MNQSYSGLAWVEEVSPSHFPMCKPHISRLEDQQSSNCYDNCSEFPSVFHLAQGRWGRERKTIIIMGVGVFVYLAIVA